MLCYVCFVRGSTAADRAINFVMNDKLQLGNEILLVDITLTDPTGSIDGLADYVLMNLVCSRLTHEYTMAFLPGCLVSVVNWFHREGYIVASFVVVGSILTGHLGVLISKVQRQP